jgi:regulator of RNase E activity RraB
MPSVDEASLQSGLEVEPADENETDGAPFIIHKESGPLYPDLLVQLNTSELNPAAFDSLRAFTAPQPPAPESTSETDDPAHSISATPSAMPEPSGATGDLIESIVSSIETSFDAIHGVDPESVFADDIPASEPEPAVTEFRIDTEQRLAVSDYVEDADVAEETVARDELQEIFEELKEKTGDLKPLLDFETHYSLGLAYKDMDLLDDAISEFQMAFRTAGVEDLEGDCIHCCNMLGVCFKRKEMYKVAIMWFERGLKISNRTEDEYQALRFEIGLCYEELGEMDSALEVFTQVYGTDVNYRKVGEKLKQLRALQSA